MPFWKRLFSRIGLRTDRRSRAPKNAEVRLLVSLAAKREGKPELEFVSQLLVAGLQKYYSRQDVLPKWESLTPRQRDVARLIERGMTNEAIAARLSLSRETVKTHVANILEKFGAKEKSEVRHMLGTMKTNHWI